MGLNHSPKIVTNGLVFAYDMGNTNKSWKGKPTDNKIYTTPISLSVYAYVSGPVSTSNVLDGSNNVRTVNRYTITSTVGTRRAAIYLSGITTGVTYSFSYIYKNNGTGTNIYVDASKGIPEGGVNNNTYSLNQVTTQNLANQWVYVKYLFSFSSCPTGGCILAYGNASGLVGETFDVYNEQFEISDFATPFVAGIRSNTQAILDLTGINTITAASLTYNNDNTFSFNGSGNRITSSTSLFNRTNGQEITVSCWIKPSRLAGQYSVFCTNRSADDTVFNWIFYQHTTDGAISFHGSAQNKSTYIPTVNTWVNVTNTVTAAGVSTLYVNGVSTYVVNGFTYGGTPSLLGIGADPSGNEPFQGSISNVNIYNRALTATEVKQNFNAIRGRFGL